MIKLEADIRKYENYLKDIALPVESFKHSPVKGLKVMLGHMFVGAIIASLTGTVMACTLDYEKDVFLIIILLEKCLPKFWGTCFKYLFLSTLLYVALCYFMCAVYGHLIVTRLLIQFKLLECKLFDMSEISETVDTDYHQWVSQKLRSCVIQHVHLMRLYITHGFFNN